MSNEMRKLLSGASLALGATVALANGAIAESNTAVIDQINQYNDSNSFAQVNSVFQLRDVQPSDWAFDALRNLVEKYNCIVGYPDGTFRGNRPLSRYEFAAGLNACMQQIERLIVTGETAGDPADLTRLRRLVEEFQAELATLGARVDDLEGRVDFLEDHQFSTTTKLNGEVIFNLGAAFGEEKANNPGVDLDDEITFSDRVRLNLDTSFRADGKDRLRTRLTAANVVRMDKATGTDTARFGFDGGYDYTNAGSQANDVAIEDLWYRFPVGQKTTAFLGTVGLDIDDIFAVTNPYFEDSGNGALSRFGRRNPASLRGPEGAGAGLKYKLNDKFTFSALYLSGEADEPSAAAGLLNGDYSLGAQLAFAPTDSLDLAFSYVNKYQGTGDVNLSGSTTSSNAKDPFNDLAPASSHNFGLEGSWMINEKVNLAGWLGYTTANAEGADGDAEIWNWAVNAALLDIGGKGNVLGFIFGQPPKLNESSGAIALAEDSDTSYLAELQYRYKLNSNITITPGAYVIFNPNHNDTNDTIWVGAVRTTFKF